MIYLYVTITLIIYVRNLIFLSPRRFYLTRDMTDLSPFIQGLLEWPFSELFFSDISLWNQYKYFAFSIFSCRILRLKLVGLKLIQLEQQKTQLPLIILAKNLKPIFCRVINLLIFELEINNLRIQILAAQIT